MENFYNKYFPKFDKIVSDIDDSFVKVLIFIFWFLCAVVKYTIYVIVGIFIFNLIVGMFVPLYFNCFV